MQIEKSTVVITGAGRGIGRALVEAALSRGAARVYATVRTGEAAQALADLDRDRISPLVMDIVDRGQVAAAARQVPKANLLINNAGVFHPGSLLVDEPVEDKLDMAVNYFGSLNVVRAFLPALKANGGGAIATISSIVGLAPMSALGGYSASKAALSSAITALRAELEPLGITSHGIYPGPIDTDMTRGLDLPKTSAADTAHAILDGLERNDLHIFPDAMSRDAGALWLRDPIAIERQFAAF